MNSVGGRPWAGGTGAAGGAKARTWGREEGGARETEGTRARGGEGAGGGVGVGIGGGALAEGIVETPGVGWACKATLNTSTISMKLDPSTLLMPGPTGPTGQYGGGGAT